MGIWLIYYGVANSHREEYLHWFEGQHIDEKLARPGYHWACHYEVSANAVPDNADCGYIAMFGAQSTRVFFDPSPAQIKPNQDELTRTMIGYRVKPVSAILTEEWSERPDTAASSMVNSAKIRLGIFAETADDQEIAAWCAQSHFPTLANSNGLVVARKWLSSFGANRHMVLEEHTDDSSARGAWHERPAKDLACDPVSAKQRVFRLS